MKLLDFNEKLLHFKSEKKIVHHYYYHFYTSSINELFNSLF